MTTKAKTKKPAAKRNSQKTTSASKRPIRIPRWVTNWAKAAGSPPGTVRPIAEAIYRPLREYGQCARSAKDVDRIVERATPRILRDIRSIMNAHRAKMRRRNTRNN